MDKTKKISQANAEVVRRLNTSADSKLKCNTCQPVRSADAQSLPFQSLQPTAARRPSHYCQPEAAELQRACHRKATAALTGNDQPGAGAQCSPIGLWQRQGAMPLPAAQALWQARSQAASSIHPVGPGEPSAAASLVARADCPDTGTLASQRP